MIAMINVNKFKGFMENIAVDACPDSSLQKNLFCPASTSWGN